jgi:hypothetical protein
MFIRGRRGNPAAAAPVFRPKRSLNLTVDRIFFARNHVKLQKLFSKIRLFFSLRVQ